MEGRLPDAKKAISRGSYIKIGLQMKPDIYKKFKMASAKEGRNNRDVLCDAISEYVAKKHPDIDKIDP